MLGASFPFCMACGVRVNDFCLFEDFDQRGEVFFDQRGEVFFDQRGEVFFDPRGEVFFDQRGEVFFDQVEEYQEGHWLWGGTLALGARHWLWGEAI